MGTVEILGMLFILICGAEPSRTAPDVVQAPQEQPQEVASDVR